MVQYYKYIVPQGAEYYFAIKDDCLYRYSDEEYDIHGNHIEGWFAFYNDSYPFDTEKLKELSRLEVVIKGLDKFKFYREEIIWVEEE